MRSDDLYKLPTGLPIPVDDGACDHLRGIPLPSLALPATSGQLVRLDDGTAPITVVYCYPQTGRPDVEPLGGADAWNRIPGARGCTPQTCGYRDRFDDLAAFGVRVFGLSTQDTPYQQELVARLGLPFEVLSDADLNFANALRLPTFTIAGQTLIKRLTLVITEARVTHCFYPVFPPDQDAEQVLTWLAASARTASGHLE